MFLTGNAIILHMHRNCRLHSFRVSQLCPPAFFHRSFSSATQWMKWSYESALHLCRSPTGSYWGPVPSSFGHVLGLPSVFPSSQISATTRRTACACRLPPFLKDELDWKGCWQRNLLTKTLAWLVILRPDADAVFLFSRPFCSVVFAIRYSPLSLAPEHNSFPSNAFRGFHLHPCARLLFSI